MTRKPTTIKPSDHRRKPSGPSGRGLLAAWLLAPAWLFLPLVGCGLADAALKPSRPSGIVADRAPPGPTASAGMPLVPVESTVTVAAAPIASR